MSIAVAIGAGARRSHNYVLDTKFKNAFALSKRSLDCRSTLLAWPHKVHSQSYSCPMSKAVLGPADGERRPEVRCHFAWGPADQYRCKVSDVGGSRVLCGPQL
jgi:hypothetical protein